MYVNHKPEKSSIFRQYRIADPERILCVTNVHIIGNLFLFGYWCQYCVPYIELHTYCMPFQFANRCTKSATMFWCVKQKVPGIRTKIIRKRNTWLGGDPRLTRLLYVTLQVMYCTVID
jgi:hypothetical protein